MANVLKQNVLKQINLAGLGGLCTRLQLIYKAIIGVGGGLAGGGLAGGGFCAMAYLDPD